MQHNHPKNLTSSYFIKPPIVIQWSNSNGHLTIRVLIYLEPLICWSPSNSGGDPTHSLLSGLAGLLPPVSLQWIGLIQWPCWWPTWEAWGTTEKFWCLASDKSSSTFKIYPDTQSPPSVLTINCFLQWSVAHRKFLVAKPIYILWSPLSLIPTRGHNQKSSYPLAH